MGNFNEVLHQSEHVGVQERSYAQMEGFREMVDVCGLNGFGFEGRNWTYEKMVAGGTHCRVCLDRALMTPEWCAFYSIAMVRNLTAVLSDHGPILLKWKHETTRHGRKAKGRFKDEIMWEYHVGFSPLIYEASQGEGKARNLAELQAKISIFA
jgi:hypothetical protein